MKIKLGTAITILLLALSGQLSADDKLQFGTLTFSSPREHMVGIDDSLYLADDATIVDGTRPSGENRLEQLLAEIPPGTDVDFAVDTALSKTGFAVLKSIAQIPK